MKKEGFTDEGSTDKGLQGLMADIGTVHLHIQHGIMVLCSRMLKLIF